MDLNDYIEFVKKFIKDEKLNRRKLNRYCRNHRDTYFLDFAKQIFLKQIKTIQGTVYNIDPIELFDYAFKWNCTYEGVSSWIKVNLKFYEKFNKYQEKFIENIWNN